MNESITVIDKNGNSIVAEGIACIQFVSSDKKYILYTLNEKVENDLTKMYVGEIGLNVGELDRISDEEWLHIKTTLNGISHGEINPDLKYISMKSLPLNIGIPKKLAIKADVKQALSDRYNIEVMKESQGNGPVNESAMQPSTGFFNNDVVDKESEEPAIELSNSSDASSIFENPLKPDLSAPTVGPEPIATPADSTPESIPTDIAQSVMQVAPAPTENSSEETPSIPDFDSNPGLTLDMNPANDAVSTIEAIPNSVTAPVLENAVPTNPVLDELSTDVMNDVNESLVPEDVSGPVEEVNEETPEPVTLEQTLPSHQIDGIGIKPVSKEEALAALEVINRYILQNGGEINSLSMDSKVEISMPAEEVVVPKIELEDTSDQEPVIPNKETISATETMSSVVEEPVISTPSSVENDLNVIPTIEPVIPTALPTNEPVVNNATPVESSIPNGGSVVENSTIPEASSPQVIPEIPSIEPTPTNAPSLIQQIDLNEPKSQETSENNFISMGVDDINNMVASSTTPTTGDALAMTETNNLINLDAIPTIPEVDIAPQIEPVSSALTSTPISNAYVNSDPSGIPVTLPNNYNAQGATDPSSVLGPGSLPVENENN